MTSWFCESLYSGACGRSNERKRKFWSNSSSPALSCRHRRPSQGRGGARWEGRGADGCGGDVGLFRGDALGHHVHRATEAAVDDVALGRLGARLGLLRRLLVGLVEVTLEGVEDPGQEVRRVGARSGAEALAAARARPAVSAGRGRGSEETRAFVIARVDRSGHGSSAWAASWRRLHPTWGVQGEALTATGRDQGVPPACLSRRGRRRCSSSAGAGALVLA